MVENLEMFLQAYAGCTQLDYALCYIVSKNGSSFFFPGQEG